MSSPRTIKITELPASTQALNDSDSFVAVQAYGSALLTVKLPASKVLAAARLAGAEAAASNGMSFATQSEAANSGLLTSRLVGATLTTAGFGAPGDGGGAVYQKVNTEPSHAGKFVDLAGGWWELVTDIFYPEMFGIIQDGAGNARPAIQSAVDRAAAVGGRLDLLAKTYLIDAPIVIPRANGSGGVSGSVKRFAICGRGGIFSDSGTIVKATAAMKAIFTTEAWATNTIVYQSGWSIASVTIDGDSLAENGIATTAADSSFDQLYIRNCTNVGLWHTQYLQDGTLNATRPDRCRFNRLLIRDCGIGFQSLSSADCTFTIAEVWHCGICMDVDGSGWSFDNVRTYTNAATASYVSRFAFGQGSRIVNSIFGGGSGNPDVYQVEVIHRFDPIVISNTEFSGPAGKGVRCSTVHSNLRGLITFNNCTFTNEAGATQCSVWQATNSASFLIEIIDCVFRVSVSSEAWQWESGAEAGQIYTENLRRVDADARGSLVVYTGLQLPGATSTDNPGVTVSGANPLTLTAASKRTILRTLELSSETSWILPATAGQGQEFQLIRGITATGVYSLNIYLSDGVTLLASMPIPGRRVTVMYSTSTSEWHVIENTPITQPSVYGAVPPGVTIAGAGFNPYTFTAETKQTVMRNAVLTSNLSFILPAVGGEGQEYVIIRTAAATGAFNHNIYLSDGTTLVKSITSPSYRVRVTYVSSLGGWVATETTAIT